MAPTLHDIQRLLEERGALQCAHLAAGEPDEQAGPAPNMRARTLRPTPKHPKARRRHSGHPVPPL